MEQSAKRHLDPPWPFFQLPTATPDPAPQIHPIQAVQGQFDCWPDFKQEQLFDLQADPAEENDRIADPAQEKRLSEMRRRFSELKAAAR